MDRNELRALAERIRRNATNRDLLDLCDGTLELLVANRGTNREAPRFDKTAYQREYMRGYRRKKILKSL